MKTPSYQLPVKGLLFFGRLMFTVSVCAFLVWAKIPYPDWKLGFVWLLSFWIGVAAYSIGSEERKHREWMENRE